MVDFLYIFILGRNAPPQSRGEREESRSKSVRIRAWDVYAVVDKPGFSEVKSKSFFIAALW